MTQELRYEYTQKEINEYLNCKEDIIYFCEKYCGIKLREYQKDLIGDNFLQTINSRAVGYTTLIAVKILHTLIFESEKTIAYIASTPIAVRFFREHVMMLWNTTTFPKKFMPTITEDYKTRTRFNNGNIIMYTKASSCALRGWSISHLYMDDIQNIPEDTMNAIFMSVFPCIAYGYAPVFWIGGISSNGNITKEYNKKFKVVKLPHWVIDDDLYIRYKNTVQIYGEEIADAMLLAT